MSVKTGEDGMIKIQDKLMNSFEAAEAVKALRTNVIFSGEEKRSIGLTS